MWVYQFQNIREYTFVSSIYTLLHLELENESILTDIKYDKFMKN